MNVKLFLPALSHCHNCYDARYCSDKVAVYKLLVVLLLIHIPAFSFNFIHNNTSS